MQQSYATVPGAEILKLATTAATVTRAAVHAIQTAPEPKKGHKVVANGADLLDWERRMSKADAFRRMAMTFPADTPFSITLDDFRFVLGVQGGFDVSERPI